MSGDDDETLKGPYLHYQRPADRDELLIMVIRYRRMHDGTWISEILQQSGGWWRFDEGAVIPYDRMTMVVNGFVMHHLLTLDSDDGEITRFFKALSKHLGITSIP